MSHKIGSNEHWDEHREDYCTKCGQYKPGQVKGRYSFGVYAGRLCKACCKGYRDHCGIDQQQGSPSELEAMGETYWEEDY